MAAEVRFDEKTGSVHAAPAAKSAYVRMKSDVELRLETEGKHWTLKASKRKD